jgi:hypothetical protein
MHESGRPAQLLEYTTDYLDHDAFAVEATVRELWSSPNVTFISPRTTLCKAAAVG